VIENALTADGPVMRAFGPTDSGRPTSVSLAAIGSAMACPLRSPEGPVGVLYLDGQGERIEFSERDRGMLTLLSNVAALVVSQASRTREAERVLQRIDHLATAEGIAGGIAHDLKNVLTVLRSGTELLAESPPADPDLEAILGDMRVAVESADALAHRMMDIARLRSGRRVPRPVSVLLAGAADLARRSVGERLDLQVVDEAPGTTVHVEPYSIQRALLNLLLNAADASERHGRVELRADLDAEGTRVRLRVIDRGHGVPATVRPRLFEPFFTTKDSHHGTGLGLATSLRIAHDHEGSLTHTDTPGGGATFELVLPVR
jgi:signal transduction histidine kinase